MDTDSGICTGCGRTLEEIARWAIYPPEVRHRVMAELPERMKRVRHEKERA
jgi:predicted Fe-S protein YdhL (DUF1289 family)